jgi:thiol-disulfide isomerase/thioredoxin
LKQSVPISRQSVIPPGDAAFSSLMLVSYLLVTGCGHCKALAPTFEQLGNAYPHTKDVKIASIDADAHKELATRFGVSGYPTLKYFEKGSTTANE